MRVVPCVLLVTLTVLAGCVRGSEGATALDLRAAAEREAMEWDADAVLVSALSAELDDETRRDLNDAVAAGEIGGNGSDEDRAEAVFAQAFAGSDGMPGDGRTNAWMYTFAADDRQLTVLVDSDGDVLRLPGGFEGDLFGQGVVPVGDWRIDSDEATSTVRTHNAKADDAMGAGTATVVYALGQEEDGEHPFWALLIEESGGEDLGIYLVDATNGTYVGEFNLTELFLGLLRPAEIGRTGGQFAALVGDTASHSFAVVEDGHEELLVTLVLDPDLPLSSVTMTVTGPDGGDTASAGEVLTLLGESVGQLVFDAPTPGTYTVDVSMDVGALQNYEVLWCATGFYIDINVFGGRDPCQRA